MGTLPHASVPNFAMPELELSPAAQHWVNVVLIWIGFGALAGLLARVVLPFRRSAGPVATLVVGVTGSALGLTAFSFLSEGRPPNPISPIGFLAATAGAFVLLLLYSLLLSALSKDAGGDGS